MELKKELEDVLRKAPALADSKIDLEDTTSGRVGGFIISGSFGGMDQTSRQDLVWDHLEKELKPELQVKIVSLLTLTPEEAEDDEDDTDVSGDKSQPGTSLT